MIIDCHTHIASRRHLPQEFFDGWASTIKAGLPRSVSPAQERRVLELLANLNHDPQCEQMVREMDTAGIDIGVLLVVDFAFAFPSPEVSIESLHQEVAEIARRTGRFVAFAGVDPRRGQSGLDLLDRAVREWGFTGLKLYPPCGYSPSDRRLFPYYELCASHGIP